VSRGTGLLDDNVLLLHESTIRDDAPTANSFGDNPAPWASVGDAAEFPPDRGFGLQPCRLGDLRPKDLAERDHPYPLDRTPMGVRAFNDIGQLPRPELGKSSVCTSPLAFAEPPSRHSTSCSGSCCSHWNLDNWGLSRCLFGRPRVQAFIPPSTVMPVPVMFRAAGLARNATANAISSALA
jgi:hypothetical protein